MEEQAVRKKAIALVAVGVFLSLPIALAVVAGWDIWGEYRDRRAEEAAYNQALREAAERAADVVMPVPSLTDDVITLDVPADKFEPELQRIVRLAHGIGGSAASWNDGETVRIVANVPTTAAELFRDAVNSNVLSMTTAGDSEMKTVVQIVLRPVAKP
jgi:hypothetical protein